MVHETLEELAKRLGAPEVTALTRGANHLDVKAFTSARPLAELVPAMLGRRPRALRALFAIRNAAVRVLGLRPVHAVASDSASVGPFRVQLAREDLWVGGIDDAHLSAWLCVLREPRAGAAPRIHLGTIVRYNDWRGPLYFNVIRPFHHLLVGALARSVAG